MNKFKTVIKNRKTYVFLLTWLIVVLVNFFPYLRRGIPGNVIDMIYQMERIEGLKDSFVAGTLIPRIYERFFYGYGYGSPLFYSDFFFAFPAILRLLGFSITQSVKIFILLMVSVSYIVSFCCFKSIFKKFDAALLGSVLLGLSQFYLMDLTIRIGLGEYIAGIFVPVLFLAIYDYFANDGKRIYLFGIAFGGLLLSHTIMVFLGAIITVLVFVFALFLPNYRKKVFVGKKIGKLTLIAFMTFGVTSFYFIPMLEQMASGRFGYNNPWTFIGDYVPSLITIFYPKGTMFFVCEGGIGVAIWSLVLYGFFKLVIDIRNSKKLSVDYCMLVIGTVMSILTTNVFPWEIFNNTILNSIQFTFRFLPYILCILVLAGVSLWNRDENMKRRKCVFAALLLLSIAFGFYQNFDAEIQEATYSIDDDFLNTSGSLYVGRGEWMPEVLEVESFLNRLIEEPELLDNINNVMAQNGEYVPLERLGGNCYRFEISGDMTNVSVPVIFYKGYTAYIENGNNKEKIAVKAGEEGFVEIKNESSLEGTVYLQYSGTLLQKISILLTLTAVLSLLVMIVVKGKRVNG